MSDSFLFLLLLFPSTVYKCGFSVIILCLCCKSSIISLIELTLTNWCNEHKITKYRVEDECSSNSTRLLKTLEAESKLDASMVEKDKNKLLEKAHNAIVPIFNDKMFSQVSKEKTTVGLWTKLENLVHDKVLGEPLESEASVVLIR